jgi:hypothetical protein
MLISIFNRNEGVTTQVEAEQVGDAEFKLLENDLVDPQLTTGVTINAKRLEDSSYEVISVQDASTFVTRRFILSANYTESDYRVLGDELVKHGGFWQVDLGYYLTINVPRDFPYDIDRVMSELGIHLTEKGMDQRHP